MAHIIDTAGDFEEYARRAALKGMVDRELLWRQLYEGGRPELFEAFRASPGVGEDRHALVRDLSSLREQARRAAPVVRQMVQEVEPAVAEALGLPPDPAPVHVLLVGNASINAVVGRLDGDVALFHCLTLHFSAPNRSPHPRRGPVAQYYRPPTQVRIRELDAEGFGLRLT
jgi:hypothetical protein